MSLTPKFRYEENVDIAYEALRQSLLEDNTVTLDNKQTNLEDILEAYLDSLDESTITDWDLQRQYDLWETYMADLRGDRT